MPVVPVRPTEPTPVSTRASTAGPGAMWRWRSHLVPVRAPVSLGEGGTPLVDLDVPKLPGRVLLKDERANPTGSFKDRLASGAVSRAREVGADTVAVASTGNAGLAVAAYAAAGGLRCVLLAAADLGLPAPTAAALSALGARVVLTPTPGDRWVAARTGVDEHGWFPVTNDRVPPVASHPAGVQAYRTIAYEVAESLGWTVPDWVVVPASRGDGLFGIWSGFVELAELGWTRGVPRMLAVERWPSLTDALSRGLDQPERATTDGPAEARSISDPQATAMSAHTIRASHGDVVVGDDAQIRAAWSRLAARGVLLELSSAAALHGATVLADRGDLDGDTTVVLLGTAGPYAQESLAGAKERPDGDAGVGARRLTDPADADQLHRLAG